MVLISVHILKGRAPGHRGREGYSNDGHGNPWARPVVQVTLIPARIGQSHGWAAGNIKERHDRQFVWLACAPRCENQIVLFGEATLSELLFRAYGLIERIGPQVVHGITNIEAALMQTWLGNARRLPMFDPLFSCRNSYGLAATALRGVVRTGAATGAGAIPGPTINGKRAKVFNVQFVRGFFEDWIEHVAVAVFFGSVQAISLKLASALRYEK